MTGTQAGSAVPSTRKSYVMVGYALLVTLLGAGLPSPLYGLYQREFVFSTGMLTVAFALYSLTLLPALLICGPWSDRAGRHPVLLTGLVLTVAAIVLFLFARSLTWVLVARAVQGLGVAAVLTASTALAAELHPRGDRARAAFLTTTTTPVGLATGSLAAGALAQYVPAPTRTCFAIELLLLVPALLAALRLPSPRPQADSATGDGAAVSSTDAAGTERKRLVDPGWRGRRSLIQRPRLPRSALRPFLLVSVAAAAAWAVGGVFLSVAPSYAAELAGTRNLALLGGVPALMFFAALLGEFLGRLLPSRYALLSGAGVLAAGLGAVAASFTTASLVVLFVGAVLAGAGLGLTFLGALTVINLVAPPDQRGGVAAAFYLWVFGGNAVPVLALGLLTKAVSLATAIVGFAVLVGTIAILNGILTLPAGALTVGSATSDTVSDARREQVG